MNPAPESKVPSAFSPKLVLGVTIILLGVALTLDNLGLVNAHILFRLWPLILVALGLSKLRQTGTDNTGAWVLILVGGFLLMSTFGLLHLTDAIGPLLIVGLGIFVVVKALRQSRGVPPALERSEGFVQGTAIFSGLQRRVSSQTFRGGELTAIFGGFEADLRQSAMDEGQARLDVFVLFGGGEIRVPEGWEIVNQATSILGAIADKTWRNARPENPSGKLVITGMTLFGGIEVKG